MNVCLKGFPRRKFCFELDHREMQQKYFQSFGIHLNIPRHTYVDLLVSVLMRIDLLRYIIVVGFSFLNVIFLLWNKSDYARHNEFRVHLL